MASITAIREDSFLSQLEKARLNLRTKYDRAHKVLTDSETGLLSELDQLETNYKGEYIGDQILQLSASKDLLIATLKGNDNQSTLEQGLVLMESRIRELEVNLEAIRNSMRSVVLEWNVELDKRLSEIGKIRVRGLSNYKEKGYPKLVSCKHNIFESASGGVFYSPKSITIDAQTENVYICDFGNNRIQVFNKFLQFLFMFCENLKEPVGMCVEQGKVYVTQSIAHCLNVYTNEGNFIRSVGKKGEKELEFQWPRGVAVSSEKKLIYVCDSNNNRVHCLNLDLTFSCSITDIYHPSDIKVFAEVLVVLKKNSPFVRHYNHSHQLIREMIILENAINPNYFCLDGHYNILMTDQIAECVLIFSSGGELIHKFGKRGERKGEFIGPRGIVLDSEDRIIVVSSNPENCVQLF